MVVYLAFAFVIADINPFNCIHDNRRFLVLVISIILIVKWIIYSCSKIDFDD